MQEEPPVTVSSAARSPNPAAPKRPKKSKKAANQDFDLEDNDNWPEVDVGNLIIDLDADIDKAMSSSSSTATATPSTVAAGQTASTTTTTATVSAASNVPATTSAVSSSAVAATVAPSTASSSTTKLKSLMTSNCNSASSSGGGGGSGSVTQTLTETLSSSAIGSASANDKEKDKSLKMKIKRNKQGASSRHPEGKLEIVKKADGTTSVATAAEPMETNSEDKSRETSPVPNGAAAAAASPASNFIPENTTGTLSAADIVAAAKAAVVKHGGPKAVGGNKVRLTNSSDVKPSNTAASSSKKEGKQNGQQSSSQSSSSSSSTTSETKVHKSYSKSDSGVGGPPAAKRPKVDASVGTEIGTMTEPDCLGPLDPGTSVNLEGIVWNETDGVLVINVTWRGKTYVGTLLDSTRHVNQWAPPRYSESPTSELESRTSKGRGAKRSATRGNSGTPVETETRKNLRSSKSKSKSNLNSPAKRKGRGSDGDEKSGDEKRKRTDSSRNSPDDDEDSEKGDGPTNQGGNESDKDSATSSVKGKDDKDFSDFMPKDKEEEKYIPPPPLPYALVCPKSSCKKRYRQHNGLRFHVSAAHPELLDELGNIRDTSEIERMEKEAKERLNKDSNSNEENTKNGAAAGEAAASTDSSNSGSSSKTSTPGPSDSSQQATDLSTQQPISVPLPPTLKGPPLDAKPIPVSEMGGIPANVRPPPPILQTTAAALPLVARGPNSIAAKPIRPPVNARPIVPATGPQIMPAGSLGAAPINLKPIQPRPAIMADPSPNLALDDLKKAKKQKKMSISPGNSPPRMSNNQNGNSPKVKLADNQKMNLDQNNHPSQNPINNPIAPAARSPAYSDISDDENNDRRQKSSSSQVAPAPPPLPPPPVGAAPGIPAPIPPVTGPAGVFPFGATLPTVPISPVSQPPKEKKEISGPQPGTVEYEKMLLAYGFPPFPYPIPQGMDPNVHIHMLTTNPDYKAKYEKDRTEKEKAFKEQIDRDNREKDRKAGVKLPPPTEADQLGILKPVVQPDIPTNANVEKPKSFSSPMISVKPEFRQDHHNHHQAKKEVKNESSSSSNSKKPEDEGIKATMETRGPPPATPTSFASLMHPALMGRSPFPYDQALLASMPPQILASLYGSPGAGPSQYMQQMQQMQSMQHALGGMRPPFMPPTSNPEDLSRSAALAMAALSSSGSSATKALDLLQQHASQYYAAVGAASSAPPSAVTTTTSSSNPSSHKIHELSERALLKSPVTSHGGPNSRSTSSPSVHRVTPTSMASTLGKSSDLSKRTPSPARTTTPNSSRSRSPPPLRHVHTHTHTHFGVPGLGYHPLMSPSAGVTGPPAAHSPFPPAGFPSHLLPGKPPLPGTLPSFPPPK